MTDTRLPETYLTSAALGQLSDKGHRVFIHSLIWSTTQGTDGRLPRLALRYLHPDGVNGDDVNELVCAGLWKPNDDDTFDIPEWTKHQTPAAEVERARQANRDRQQRHRNRLKDTDEDDPP